MAFSPKNSITKSLALYSSAIIVLSLAAYYNALSNGFIWDDHGIVENPSIRGLGPANIKRFFTDPEAYHAPGEIYRPLYLLSFAMDYGLYGLSPAGYHLTNMALHAVNSVLLFLFILVLLSPREGEASEVRRPRPPIAAASFLAAAVFAVHPIHTESVTWIKGRDDLLAALFLLPSFMFYMRAARSPRTFYAVSVLLFVLSLLSKEMAITLPLLLLLYDLCLRPGRLRSLRAWALYLPYIGAAVIFVAVRTLVLGRVGQMSGYLAGGLSATLYTMAEVVAMYMRLLVLPVAQSADYMGFPVTGSATPWTIFYFAVIAAVLFAASVAYFRNYRRFAFGVLWFFAALLPVLNLVPVKIQIAERFLYIPSVGPAVLLAAGAGSINRGAAKKAAYGLLAVTTAVFFYATHERNKVWKDEFVFWEDVLRKYPTARAYTNYGLAFDEAGRVQEAIRYYEKALSMDPGYLYAAYNLALNYEKAGETEKALSALLRARGIEPENPLVHARLGDMYRKKGRRREAISSYEKALGLDPGDAHVRASLAELYMESGEKEKAMRLLSAGP